MKKTKFYALFMAIVMIMGLVVLPVSACTVDEDGNVIPCSKVEKRGYCDMPHLAYYILKGENVGMYQIDNPYYKKPTPSPETTAKPATPSDASEPQTGRTEDSGLQSAEEYLQDFADILKTTRGCDDIVDYETLTIEYVNKNGQKLGYKSVVDPNTNSMTHYGPDGKMLDGSFDIDWNAENPFSRKTQTTAPSTQAPVETSKPETKHFDDVPDDAWYAEAVNALAANGILKGYDDGLFHPNDNVTIGELAVIIYRLATGEEPVGKTGVSDDILRYCLDRWRYGQSNHWAAYALETLYSREAGYMLKWTDRIDEPATRGDAIYTVYKLAKMTIGTTNMTVVPKWDFPADSWVLNADIQYTNAQLQEKSRIPDLQVDPSLDYCRGMIIVNGIVHAYKYGIVHGVDEKGTCNPLGNLTRAELCQMLYNAGITKFTVKAKWHVQGYGMGGVAG